MKALRINGPERLELDEAAAEPRIEHPTDAIVEVSRTAICGADLFPYHGLTPGFEAGTIPGHEWVGVVREVGPEVKGIEVGQRVVNTSMISDGTCEHCRSGRPMQCEHRALFGYSGVYERLEGGQAQLVRAPVAERSLWPIPEGVDDDDAVFVADMLPTGLSAVRRAGVGIGDTVVILGCGTVGLMATMVAVPIARRVIAVDGIEARRDAAAALGAEPVAPEAAADAVAAATGGLGADAVIEAAGAKAALDAAFSLVRGRGTICVVGAHFEPDYPLEAGRMFEAELTLRFAMGDPLNDRETLLGMIADERLRPSRLISDRFPLERGAEAYEKFDRREATKVVLTNDVF
ncbi:MAG TPA: alcohol dehydrogenase catalytic domain-containing protein [Solirubrobacterales bacterium]|nr:alcohol dehydrogenase catalytic domain-containing protein [Solirubrobacterales bacterium]